MSWLTHRLKHIHREKERAKLAKKMAEAQQQFSAEATPSSVTNGDAGDAVQSRNSQGYKNNPFIWHYWLNNETPLMEDGKQYLGQ